jgi:hypothetical protein
MNAGMGDEGTTGGKRRNGLSIFLGIVGAVLGFVGGMALTPYNRMDPIASGMIALFVFGPMGALAGAFLGATLGRRGRGAEAVAAPAASDAGAEAAADAPPAPSPRSEAIDTGTLARKFSKGLFLAIAGAAALGVVIYLFQTSNETPSLNPRGPNPVLQIEVRLPAGAPMPAEKDIRASLHSRPHGQVWVTMKQDLFRRDGERPVLVGEAELAFRTADRQIQMEIAGQPDRTFYLTLLDKAPHTAELGAWQPKTDGSEIRYRAKWPGRE